MSADATQLRAAQAAFTHGNFTVAFAEASRILVASPAHAQARALRANAALKLERWPDAIADLDWLLVRQPNHATIRKNLSVCWMRIGNREKDKGDIAAAERAYRQALATDDNNHDAHYNFGLLGLETAHFDDAVAHLRRAVDADPENVAFSLKLAEAQIAAGDSDDAMNQIERIAKHGGTREQLQQCGRLLLGAKSPDAAKALARRLIEQRSGTVAWAREFCQQLRKNSDLAGSRELLGSLRKSLTDAGECLRIDLAVALGLPATYRSRADLEATRAEYLARLADFVEAYPPAHVTAIATPPEAVLWDNFHLAYQGEDDREPQRRFATWSSASLQALLPRFSRAAPRSSRARPRLALVSSRFHRCTVGSYFTSWVEYLANAGWELILAHVGDTRDELSARLAAAAHGEIALAGGLAEAAGQLHELGADAIVYPELGMDYRTLGLAGLRLAPVQVCAWGHPVTTGLSTIDAFFSCAEMEPADAISHYSERLLTLPGLGTRYLSHPVPTAAARTAIGLPENRTLYLVPQSLFKLHPDNDVVFADIARRDPAAALVFFDSRESGAQNMVGARIVRAFSAAGIDAAGRTLFLPPRDRAAYLQVNMACDVMLDTLHFSGGNTSLDALHAGLPVVTCPGRFMRGRQSMAMLKHLGCDELIAQSPQQLAALAVEIANDRPRRDALAMRIRERLPELTQSDEPLRALDAALKSLVDSL
ncbi:MAG: tetratricopeptide repeat protein [Rudaea sp.]